MWAFPALVMPPPPFMGPRTVFGTDKTGQAHIRRRGLEPPEVQGLHGQGQRAQGVQPFQAAEIPDPGAIGVRVSECQDLLVHAGAER